MPPSLSNTEELLLVCARKDLTEAQKEKARALAEEGVSWQNFFESVGREKATFLVYTSLKKNFPSLPIPRLLLNDLREDYLFIISKTTTQYAKLKGVLSLFAEKKIPTVPLKGVILAKRLYGDIAARSLSTDCDLLIGEKDKEAARILLQEAGYSLNRMEQVLKPWQYCFTKPKAVQIDLHWDITKLYRSRERIAGFWENTRLVEEDGVTYYEFKEEELLLYLSAHMLSNSCFTQLRYPADIHQLLHKYKEKLDWKKIIKEAKGWRLSGSLYAGLRLARELFNSELPVWVLDRLKPNPFKSILIRAFVNKEVVLGGSLRRRLINSFIGKIFFELIEAKSVRDYFSIVFPPPEVRDKDWAARIVKGLSALSKILRRRKSMPCRQRD